MEDEAYVRELLAILTNPSPTGIDPDDPYGQADDGIDRYDGFGRDVRVTAATVVPGDHGAQVEIGFVLDLPDRLEFRSVPPEGSLRLPVAAEWRAASNYRDPADYAPEVARQVSRGISRHIASHQPAVPPRSDLPDRDVQWALLLENLGRVGAVREISPGRLEVRHDDDDGTVEIVTVLIAPDQWEQILTRWQPLEDHFFEELIGPRQDDEIFLVFWEGDLELSVREALPPVRPRRPVTIVPGGAWHAYPPSGA